MGVRNMQGVPAHLEYIKTNSRNKRKVNCKFWKNQICYNTNSTKFGEHCGSKKDCMYSIPISDYNFINQDFEFKNMNKNSIESIITKYFYTDLEEIIKINNSLYKIKTSYNNENDNLRFNIFYRNNKLIFKYNLKLKDVIRIEGNQVIFKVKSVTLINEINKINKELGELIKKNNSQSIIRRASIDNNEEIIKKRDSLIMYTSYIITRELLKLYK